jgi:tetratricopeptide (TPR) repeat protein
MFNLAVRADNAGDLSQADRLYRAVLQLRPDHRHALHRLSIVEYRQGRPLAAISLLDRLLAIRPDFPEAHYNRGTILQALGRSAEALMSLETALSLKPDYRDAAYNRGLALSALRRFEEALASYDRALAVGSDHAESHFGRGYVLFELQRFEEALAAYDRMLTLSPDNAIAHNNRGNTLKELGRYEAAAKSYERALALRPDYVQAYVNRADLLKQLERFDEAVTSYDRALALQPKLPHALNNRALALVELQRFAAALESHDRAIQLDPENADHRLNRAVLLLQLGNFADGWREYEWRRKQQVWTESAFTAPEWTGESVAGKRVFLFCEQGFGDAIQFARFAGSVTRLGGTAVLGARPGLERMLERLQGGPVVVRDGAKPPVFDLRLPLMSAPHVLGFAPDQVPAAVPYLSADPDLVERWSRRLPAGGFKIGIAWQGKFGVPVDRGRSIPLRAFAPLGRIPDVRLISLQKYEGVEQLADLPAGMTVETLGGDFDAGPDAFLDTAAVMMHLDLVVTSDSAVAHLAGALARPVWIVLRQVADWRWLLDREDSPWYPTARLFRQRRAGDWDEVFTRVAAELARLAATGR